MSDEWVDSLLGRTIVATAVEDLEVWLGDGAGELPRQSVVVLVAFTKLALRLADGRL